MANVFVLPEHPHSRCNATIRCDSLKCLYPGLLIKANRVDTLLFVGTDRIAIGSADFGNSQVVIGIGLVFACQPVLIFMRPKRGTTKQVPDPATADRVENAVYDHLARQFPMRPVCDRTLTIFRILAGLLENRGLLLWGNGWLPTASRLVGQQRSNFLLEHVRLFSAFDADEPLPVIPPPPAPDSNRIVLQANFLLNRLIIFAFKGEQDDSTALGKRNLRCPCGRELFQDGVLLFGHNDLGCLPWHSDKPGEMRKNSSLSRIRFSSKANSFSRQ